MATGATHVNTTAASRPTAVTAVGASGARIGNAETGPSAKPTPAAFTAETRNDTGTPFVRPETIVEVPANVPTSVHAPPPTDFSTRYPVIGVPPFEIGAVQFNDASPSPAVAVIPDGAPGAPVGTAETGFAALASIAFTALTRKM